jgi:hypothetical protein
MHMPAPLARVSARKTFTSIAASIAMLVAILAVMLLGAAPARAQLQPMGSGSAAPAKSSSPAISHSSVTPSRGGTRVLMTNSSAWKGMGGWGLAGQAGSGRFEAADADGVKAFEKHCSQYPLTSNRDDASYVILLDQLNEKAPKKGRDRITVYNRAGIAVYSNSTRLLDDSIKDACHAIGGDYGKHHK